MEAATRVHAEQFQPEPVAAYAAQHVTPELGVGRTLLNTGVAQVTLQPQPHATPPRHQTPHSVYSATPLDNSMSSQFLSVPLTSRIGPLERSPNYAPGCSDLAGPFDWEHMHGEILRLRGELDALSEICSDFRV